MHEAETPRVLVVDDEDDAREGFSLVFSLHGFEVLEAASGREALSLLETRPVDLVLTDIHMPYMDGDELARALRERLGAGAPPILVATADQTLAAQLEHAGRFHAVFRKPVSPSDLLASAIEALRRAEEGGT